VQKPLALVVVGGSVVAPFLILLVLPVLIEIFSPADPVKHPASAGASAPAGGV
jgi:cobalt-zinc-cadmium resistance protein CzcA